MPITKPFVFTIACTLLTIPVAYADEAGGDNTPPTINYFKAGYLPRNVTIPDTAGSGISIDQAAVKPGDTFQISAIVQYPHSHTMPSLGFDFSQIGVPDSFFTYGDAHKSSYNFEYDAPTLSVSSDTPNGVRILSATAQNLEGASYTATTSILIDKTKPRITITDVHPLGSTTTLKPYATLAFSGSVSGTGSVPRVIDVVQKELAADSVTPLGTHIYFESPLSSIGEGSFKDTTLSLRNDSGTTAFNPQTAYLQFSFTVTDQAGNYVHATAPLVPIHPDATTTPPEESSATTTEDGTEHRPSNVLFLPGIEGSRLYDGSGSLLWEPIHGIDLFHGDAHVKSLSLDSAGKSVRHDIVTHDGDVIDTVEGASIYAPILSALSSWKQSGTIHDWKAASYDWRLGVSDIVKNGSLNTDGSVSYLTPTTTPYLLKTLRELASTSPSGKVTLIAHSSGGLVAKALMQSLGATESAHLINAAVLIATPQSGAPEAVGGLLYGYNQGLSAWGINLLSTAAARSFALTSPMTYDLLPSSAYFNTVHDASHPVVRLSTSPLYQKERSAYGTTITTWNELAALLAAKEGGRTNPLDSDIQSAAIANESLLTLAQADHTTLDTWTPPPGITVYQIAGWGNTNIVAGIDWYAETGSSTPSSNKRLYRPLFTEDGDGVVPAPSALLMSTSTSAVQRWWVNLSGHSANTKPINHTSMLGMNELQTFIAHILAGEAPSASTVITNDRPAPLMKKNMLRFFLHSPLTLDLYDTHGNHTGISSDGSIETSIPDSSYGTFGEVKYIAAPEGNEYQLRLHGEDTGTFTLDLAQGDGTESTTTSIEDVPTTPATIATLAIHPDGHTSSLILDEDGTGTSTTALPLYEGMTTSFSSIPTAEPSSSSTPSTEPAAPSIETVLPTEHHYGSGITRISSQPTTTPALNTIRESEEIASPLPPSPITSIQPLHADIPEILESATSTASSSAEPAAPEGILSTNELPHEKGALAAAAMLAEANNDSFRERLWAMLLNALRLIRGSFFWIQTELF